MKPLIGKCRHCESKCETFYKSFFTEQIICNDCFEKEMELRQKIVDKEGLGVDMIYKNCGSVPKV